MRHLTHNQQNGFTILELMIATLVFSVIFLATSTALLQIGKLYYKGVVTVRTQELTRGIADQLSQQLQFGTGNLTIATDIKPIISGGTNPDGSLTFSAFCIGNTRYTYRLNTQVTDDTTWNGKYDAANSRLRHALWRDTVANGNSCAPIDLSVDKPSANGEEMLTPSMRLTQFDPPDCDTATKNLCNVSVGVIYGDDDLLTPDPKSQTTSATIKTLKCATIIGDHWCAGSQFTTSVLKRVGGN